MCSTAGIQTSLWMGCPIRNLKVHSLYAAPLERFAGLRVLLRLQAPRHPPRTLSSLFSCVCSCLLISRRPLCWSACAHQKGVSRLVCVFLCVNSCCAARISKIEGISYSVGKVRAEFIFMTPTAGEWKPDSWTGNASLLCSFLSDSEECSSEYRPGRWIPHGVDCPTPAHRLIP